MNELSQIGDIARILSHPTWDIVVIFALIASGFFYGISAGKRRIAATIIYTYAALAIASSLPVISSSPTLPTEGEGFFLRAAAFLGIFLLLAFTLGSRRARGFAPASAWWQIFLLSFLQVGLLIHIILSFLPADKIALLAPITRSIFANPALHIWWLTLPLAVLIIMRRLESREE